jgi:hypothetical protein
MFHFIQRTEIWLPTLQGWFVLGILLILGFAALGRWIYPFMAVTRPLVAEVAVVEGWLPDDALKSLVEELKSYRLVLTTGYPVPYGRYLSHYEDFAQVAADTLVVLGLPKEQVIAVPRSRVERNRTLLSALRIQDWLQVQNLEVQTINVYSYGPHARRSWLLFQRALHPRQVGIVAVHPREYDIHQWWTTSNGTRSLLSEVIALLYALGVNWMR